MKEQLKEEILRFKELTGVIKEEETGLTELFSDIIKLISIASDEMKKSEIYKKLMDFFHNTLSVGDVVKNTSNEIPDITTNDDDFYKEILECVGAPITKDNMLFLYAWRQSEGGEATNNPFNTTKKMEGATLYGKNAAGVKNYPTVQDGINATCETLKLGYYTDIVDGLKNDVGLYKLSRMSSIDKWGTGKLLADVADGYLNGSTPKPKPIMKGDFSQGKTTA